MVLLSAGAEEGVYPFGLRFCSKNVLVNSLFLLIKKCRDTVAFAYHWQVVLQIFTVILYMKKISVAIICLFFLSLQTSQTSAANITEREQLMGLLEETQQQLTSMQIIEDAGLTFDLLTSVCDDDVDLRTDGELLREQSRQERRDSGLELRGAYTSGSLSETDEGEESFEQGRANLELSWDILKYGYFHNSKKAEALELEAKVTDISSELRLFQDEYLCRRYQLKKVFGDQLIQLLNIKLNFMQPVHQVERRAYFKQWSFLDDYLVSEEDVILARHELDALLADPYFYTDARLPGLPPILDVDLGGVIAAIKKDESYVKLFDAEKQWLEARERAVVTDSLRVYLRQEYDVNRGDETSDELVAGLRFSVPLHFRDSDVLNIQLKQVERKKTRVLRERINQTRIRYTELQEQLRRTVRQYYRHARAIERVERTVYMLEAGEDELLTAGLTRMRTAIDAQLELVRALEELYRRVNEIFLTARVPFQPGLVKAIPLNVGKRARLGKRGMYLWSHDFNTISNQELLAFFDRKAISTVILSAGRKTDKKKMADFLNTVEGSEVKVELMVGDNTWIYRDNFDKAVERSVLAAEKTGHLHYDIEPQAMLGYKEAREEYIRLYTELVAGVQQRLLDRTLSVSVPFHWPEETYKNLGATTDMLYVMAYGSSEARIILRRLKPIIDNVPLDKIVVALRVEDFADEWELEKVIEEIVNKTGLLQFCFHDAGRFIQQYGGRDEASN